MFPRNFRQFFIQLLAALLLAAVCLFILRATLPGLVEVRIVSTLRDEGVEVKTVPVNSVGWTEIQLGQTGLVYHNWLLGWESAEIEYFPSQLLRGEVSRISLQEPVLEWALPVSSAKPESSVEARFPAPEAAFPANIPIAPSPSGKVDFSQPAGLAGPVPESLPANPATRFSAFLEQLPFAEFTAENGRLLLSGEAAALRALDWSGRLINGSDRIMGEAWLDGAGVEATLSLDGLKSARVFKAQMGAKVNLQDYASLLRIIPPELIDPRFISSFTLPETIELDGLVELDAVNALAASGELTAGGMEWAIPQLKDPLAINGLYLAGIYKDQHSRVNGGLRIEPVTFRNLQVRETGLVFEIEDFSEFSMESEETAVAIGNWTAKAAFRGAATWDGMRLRQARLEMALSNLTGQDFGIEPFSAHLVYRDNQVRLNWSPLGIRRVGVLWMEKATMSWNFATNEGGGSFSWYDTAGAHAGNGQIVAARDEKHGFETSLTLLDTEANPVLEAAFDSEGEGTLQVQGTLPVPWMNTLNRWGDNFIPGSFGGRAPEINARFSGKSPFFKGFLRIALEGMDYAAGENVSLSGISGKANLEFNLFPRTSEPVEMRARSLNAGKVEFNDLKIVLDMPTLRTLRIRTAEATLATGSVRADPFQMDPSSPDFLSRVHCHGIPANLILELLGENRFMVEGFLSGNFQVGWESGSLILGEGRFQLMKQGEENHFRFLDKAFMTQQVASLGSLPEEIRKRLLDTLLGKGIRLESLSIEIARGPEPGMISLRLQVSGDSSSEELSIPIKGLVINNLVSGEDLARLLGLAAPVRLIEASSLQ